MLKILDQGFVDSAKVGGIWSIFSWKEKASLADIEAALRKSNARLKDADLFDVHEALINGEMPNVPVKLDCRVYNKITKALLKDTIGSRFIDNFTADKDLVVRKMAVGTDYSAPTSDQTALIRETVRKPPLSKKQVDYNSKFIIHLDFDESNGVETTIAAGGPYSTTQFDVVSAAGFAIGDAVRVQTATKYNFSRIINIAGNTITLDPSEPLDQAPLEGHTVLLCIGEAGLIGNQLEDTLFNRARLRYDKTEAKSILILGELVSVPV